MVNMPNVDMSSQVEMLEYGTVQYFYIRTERMREYLSSAFTSGWK